MTCITVPAARYVLRPLVSVVALSLVAVSSAFAFEVLTIGKSARFHQTGDPQQNSGRILIGADRALRTLTPPTCPAASEVEVEVYPQATLRDVVIAKVPLDCAKWRPYGGSYRYSDPGGVVRAIRYGRNGLRIDLRGSGFTPIPGPVGFLQAQLTIDGRTLRARFHNFVRNDAGVVLTRRPTGPAAAGEAGFWDAILGDASTEADEQATLTALRRAIEIRPGDGRSHFLLAMTHMYRFGQRVTQIQQSSPDARAELVAANAAFARAVPLLWDDATETGDSRVPGFAAAALFTQGAVDDDATMRAQGLADLERAVAVNAFFNVFDLIPVLAALPPGDPDFAEAFSVVSAYLSDPATLACVTTQPELCGNAGFAPRNIEGALTLFGDLYAKNGKLAQAQTWYNLVNALPGTPSWPFYSVIQDRVANAASRVALYADIDPSNDPPLIGAGSEACAVCHVR